MRSLILMGCFTVMAIAAQAQTNGRVRSGNLLRWTMKDGSIETMEGSLVQSYGTPDTLANKRKTVSSGSFENGRTTRVASAHATCDQRAIIFNWTALQQPGTDRFEIEQSANDGRTWYPVGTVPAHKELSGEASYDFRYNNNLPNAVFRVTAVSNTGERVSGTIVESPCNVNTYRALSPNPVYNTANIQLGASSEANVRLLLVNNMGVVVQSRQVGVTRGINQIPLEMSGLRQGLYTVFLQWDGGRQDVFKLMKQ